MSQENVSKIFRGLDAFNRRDMDGYLALMEEEVETDLRVASVEGGFHGHDGIRRWWESIFNVWPDVAAEISEAQDFGDVTLFSLRLHGHAAGSDLPLDWRTWQIARWRLGKVSWWASFNTRGEALKAVGISAQDAHADS
jgi:hypothetical protein